MNTFLYAFFVAVFTSLVITPLIRNYGGQPAWIDHPDGGRKKHLTPMPAIGGIVIYVCLLVSLAMVSFLGNALSQELWANADVVLSIVGLGGIMMLIGLWDDSKNLPAWVKFLAQVLVALTSWFFGFRILITWQTPGVAFALGVFSLPLTIVWIVGITNAFNLIDGIDGLAAGAALFAMIAILVLSVTNGSNIPALILAGMAGSTLGFLRYNFNPASVFLGDSGSLLLGFMLAVLAILSSQKSSTAFAIAVPIVAFGLPVIDTIVTVVRRFLSGKPIFLGDRQHIHHVLLERGLSPRRVVILLYGVCGVFGLFSLLFLNPYGRTIGFALAVVGAFVWFGIQQLHYPELRELNAHFSRGIQNQRKLIQGSVAIGRMTDSFRSAQNLSGLLDSISSTMAGLDFSKVEICLPTIARSLIVELPPQWTEIRDDEQECLLQWSRQTLTYRRISHLKTQVSGDFSIEFAFHLPVEFGADKHSDKTRCTLTFYHPNTGEYPYSAISLLSVNSFLEFQKALTRIRPDTSNERSDRFNVPKRV